MMDTLETLTQAVLERDRLLVAAQGEIAELRGRLAITASNSQAALIAEIAALRAHLAEQKRQLEAVILILPAPEVKIESVEHLCDSCIHEFPTCLAKNIVFGLDRDTTRTRGADADKVLECDAYYCGKPVRKEEGK